MGSFYARFDGKEDLLRYLELRLWADARERWQEAHDSHDWDALDLPDLVSTLVGILAEVQGADSRQRRLLEARRSALGGSGGSAGSDPARSFHETLSRDMRGLLLRHADRIRHPEPERAVELALTAVVATLRLRDEGGIASGVLDELDDEEWVAELARLCRSYLMGSSDGSAGRSRPDFFEIWG